MEKQPPITRTICGTTKGWRKHRYETEQPCDSCRLAYNEQQAGYHRKYREGNRDKVREYAKRRYESNPEAQREASRKWVAGNREATREYAAKWRDENREKVREYQRTHRSKDGFKEQDARNAAARRALKRGNGHEPYSVQEVLERYGEDCHLCGLPIDLKAPRSQATGIVGWELGLHVDHVIPLAKGGADMIGNVRPAHAICNLRKGDRHDAV